MVSVPDYESAIKRAVNVLRDGGKFSVLNFQRMMGAKGWFLNPMYTFIFWATHQDINRQPWKTMEKYLAKVCKEDINTRTVSCYLAWGTKPTIGSSTAQEQASNRYILKDAKQGELATQMCPGIRDM